MVDAKKLSSTLLGVVMEWVEPAIKLIGGRLDEFDQRIKTIPAGPKGESVVGPKGEDGAHGKSAYQLAVERGYPGTELQWLDSLNGAPGKAGESIVGEKGPPGESIKGDPGQPGEAGAAGAPGERGPAGESIKGDVGQPGEPGARGDKGDPGADGVGAIGPAGAEGESGAPGIPGERGADGAQGPPGAAGVDGKPGRDGKDVDLSMLNDAIDTKVNSAVAKLPAPKDGKDADPIHPDTIARMVLEEVQRVVSTLPRPKDGEPGRDALAIDVLPGIDESKSYPRGTFAEYWGGTIRAIRNTDPIGEEPRDDALQRAGWTVCMNGIATEFEETIDDGRTIKRTTEYTSGQTFVRESKTSVMIDRGVWREGEYEKGDTVSWDGSGWIAQRKTTDKPGTSDAFRLAVKRGRDGKDAKATETLHLPNQPVRLK